MSEDSDPWRFPRPRLLEALRAMRSRGQGSLRDAMVLVGCSAVFVAFLLYL